METRECAIVLSARIANQQHRRVRGGGTATGRGAPSLHSALLKESSEREPSLTNVPVVPRAWGWTWDAVVHDRTRLLRCGRCAGGSSCFEGDSKVTLRCLQSFRSAHGDVQYSDSCLAGHGTARQCPGRRRYRGLGTQRSLIWLPETLATAIAVSSWEEERVGHGEAPPSARHLIHDSQHGAPSVLPSMRSPCELCP